MEPEEGILNVLAPEAVVRQNDNPIQAGRRLEFSSLGLNRSPSLTVSMQVPGSSELVVSNYPYTVDQTESKTADLTRINLTRRY